MLRLRSIPLHLFALTENANQPVQPLLQYAAPHYCAPHHLPRFAAQCEYLFAQTGLLSIHVVLLRSGPSMRARAVRWLWNRSLGFLGLWVTSCELPEESTSCVFPTSPRGPGSLILPVLRWCRVCRRTPGCCVCSEAPSSGTPDSSCPAGTCSTTHQPPSHRTLCHLKYRRTRVIKEFMWGCIPLHAFALLGK